LPDATPREAAGVLLHQMAVMDRDPEQYRNLQRLVA
jgi:hypothetical protein